MKTISQHYIDGIKEARKDFEREGLEYAAEHIKNLRSTIKRGFPANHPVGQMLRGELDFWLNQVKGKTP